jgi:hypothetical protein
MAKSKHKPDPLAKRPDETDLQWRSRLAREDQAARDKAEPIVSLAAQGHGYRKATVMHIETFTRAESYRKSELPTSIQEWHRKGLPGFEQPAMDAMERCIVLWESRPGIGKQCASYKQAIPSGANDYDGKLLKAMDDTAEIERYQAMFHPAHWRVFEAVVRFDKPLGQSGMEEGNGPQSTASARAIVGTIANFIAMHRRG